MHRLAFLLSSGAVLLAQAPVPRGLGLVEVTRAADDEQVGHVATFQHGATATRRGVLGLLVVRSTFAGPGRTGAATSDLELWRSDDRGRTWRRAASTPTRDDADGALAVDGEQWIVAWSARDGGSFSDVFVQRYDAAADRWLAEPERLTAATGPEDQYFTPDVAQTANGASVVVFGTHRSPPNPPWTSGWSTGLRARLPGKKEWTPVVQANPDSYGVGGNVLVRGDVVDVTFRNNAGWSEAAHALRSYDAAKGELLPTSPPITPADPAEDDHTANLGIFCSDGGGGRTLLFVRGRSSAGRGRLVAAYARGDAPFRFVEIADDPPLRAGNESHTHFTLARGPGEQVWAYFSKASEDFATLWQCLLEGGEVVAAPRVVASGESKQFQVLGGVRTDGLSCGMHVVITQRTAKTPGGVVSVFGSWPALAVWAR